MRRLIIQPALRFVALRYVTLCYIHAATHCGSHCVLHCVALHRTRICMTLASALALTSRHYVKQQKSKRVNPSPSSRPPSHIRVALHYARVAFASRFPLRRHYVGIPPRTELASHVGLRRRCITRRRRSYSRYTDVNSRRSYQSRI